MGVFCRGSCVVSWDYVFVCMIFIGVFGCGMLEFVIMWIVEEMVLVFGLSWFIG